MKKVTLSFEKLKVFGIKWTIIRDVMLSFEGLYYSNCVCFPLFDHIPSYDIHVSTDMQNTMALQRNTFSQGTT